MGVGEGYLQTSFVFILKNSMLRAAGDHYFSLVEKASFGEARTQTRAERKVEQKRPESTDEDFPLG